MLLLTLAVALLASDSPAAPLTPDSLRATITKLSSYNTRNTSTPELVDAANWIADQFRAIPGAQVEIMHYVIHKGPRVPEDKDTVEVLTTFAPTQPQEPGMVIMGGHLDSINMKAGADPMTARAPGANDDGSGVAATLDVARTLAVEPRTHPTMFICFSGEEQGLYGSAAIAARAAKENWNIDAVLSNDMIGNSSNLLGMKDARHVRVFSEENARNQSRELARWIEWLARTHGERNFGVELVFRSDRFGRGGDHSSFNNQGFTAVRLVDVHEEYSRQHTPKDLPEFVDFDYLAHNAKLNALVMRSLANAGPAPQNVRIDRRQSYDTHITWRAQPGVKYVVYWRLTTDPTWTHFKEVGDVHEVLLEKASKDDNSYAVGAVGGIPVPAS